MHIRGWGLALQLVGFHRTYLVTLSATFEKIVIQLWVALWPSYWRGILPLVCDEIASN
jgi:hypothetical protein